MIRASAQVTPIEANEHAWDLMTSVHLDSDFYDVAAFRSGSCTLKKPELELLGEVAGRRLLHVQCHFGLDTLSWARRGARVTGVDFSAKAVAAARSLAAELAVPAEFVQADAQRLPLPREPYDIVFTSYGALCWLSDLDAWAAGVRRSLRAGGRLVVVEFHPILETFYPGKMTGARRYFRTAEPSEVWTEGSYADRGAPIGYFEYRWQHPLSNIVNALTRGGLAIERLEEYPYCSYPLFDELTELRDGVWHAARDPLRIPYMYSITAVRAGS